MKELEKQIAGAEKFTVYEEVRNQTTEEYFKGNHFSVDAFKKKYALVDKDETYVQALKRVCDYIASVEKTEELRTYWSKRWFHEIYNGWWHPAGSIMQGAGSGRKVSLANCTTTSLGVGREGEEWDSLESIIRNAAYTVAKSAAYRQGTGIDFSRLRPKGTTVLNSAKSSTGAIHWMQFIDGIGNFVGQAGRIPAMLFSLSCTHPDVEEFICCKADRNKVQNANISVQCTDDFYDAVRKDKNWDLIFEIPECKVGQKIYVDDHSATKDCKRDDKGMYYVATHNRKKEVFTKTVKAKDLMVLIAKNMHAHAEPGIQNIDIARKYSNSDYVYNPKDEYDSRITSTNAPVVGETMVPTDKGIFPIKYLYDHGMANVLYDSFADSSSEYLDGNYTKIGKRVKSSCEMIPAKFKLFENQRVYEIHLSGGMVLKCNSLHKWLTQNGMSKTENIVPGDKIFCPNNGISDALGMKKDEKSVSYKDGVLCGWFTGDGFYTVVYKGKGEKHGRKAVGILWREDEEYAHQLFQEKYFELKKEDLEYVRDRGRDLYETRTSSKEMYDYFCGFGYRDNKYHVPKNCFTDYDFCTGFLKGIFSSDGCFTYRRIILTSVDEKLVSDIQQLLLNWFGIQSRIRKSDSKGVVYETVDGQTKTSSFKDRYDLVISKRGFIEKFMDSIGFINERKTDMVEEYLSQDITRNTSFYSYFYVQDVVETDVYEDMYCAVVPEKHSFVVSGCISSNCSEQYLSRESLCVLSSINCGKFSSDTARYEEEMKIICPSINRFLDNVNECEYKYNTSASAYQRLSIEKLRRTGAGMTNIAGWLFMQNVSYASRESYDLMEKFSERYAYYLYKSSIALGKEKGSFGLFDREKFEKAPFVKRMMKLGLEFTAMRNVTLVSIAPSGTLSLMFRDLVMSYGVEPAFGIYYWKRTRMSGKYEYYFNVPNVVREFYKKAGFEIPMNSDSIRDDWDGSKGRKIAEFIDAHRKEVGINFKGSMDIKCSDKLELMSKIMKWVDSSISVTYMLPEDSTWKDVYEFIMDAHEKEVKSISAFPDRKMYGIISFVPFKTLATKLISEGLTIHPSNFSKEEQSVLAMSDEHVVLNTKSAPKRQQTLDADIYSITVKAEKFVIVVGKQNQYPYEIFGGKMNGLKLDMDAKHMEGKITKVSRGVYSLEFEETVIKDFSKQFTPVEKVLFRSLSLMLRHGIPIEFVVDQLNKANDNMFSVSAAIVRVLKKYIQDGQKVSGSRCPKCGSESLFYNDGCVQCSCGWSACS